MLYGDDNIYYICAVKGLTRSKFVCIELLEGICFEETILTPFKEAE